MWVGMWTMWPAPGINAARRSAAFFGALRVGLLDSVDIEVDRTGMVRRLLQHRLDRRHQLFDACIGGLVVRLPVVPRRRVHQRLRVQHLRVHLQHLGGLGGVAAVQQVHLQRCKHFRRGELAQVVQVARIVGRLQADEDHLGQARETLGVEIDGQVGGTPTEAFGLQTLKERGPCSVVEFGEEVGFVVAAM
ncbi:MAG: hypothetical protein HC793_04280 [Aquincola sp.]|nr:hypothetical protein [Aquincola sp.]